MSPSKQTHKFDYFICYHLEFGWHVTRPNQGLSLGRGKSLGTRLVPRMYEVVFKIGCIWSDFTKENFKNFPVFFHPDPPRFRSAKLGTPKTFWPATVLNK